MVDLYRQLHITLKLLDVYVLIILPYPMKQLSQNIKKNISTYIFDFKSISFTLYLNISFIENS